MLLYILTYSLYCFQISVTNLENATIIRYPVEGGSTTSYVPNTPLNPGRYALRIRAENEYGPSLETSSVVDFTICKLKCTPGFYVSHTMYHIVYLHVCMYVYVYGQVRVCGYLNIYSPIILYYALSYVTRFAKTRHNSRFKSILQSISQLQAMKSSEAIHGFVYIPIAIKITRIYHNFGYSSV